MNIENLNRVIKVLKPIEDINLEMVEYVTQHNKCGTVACVIGHCLASDEFGNRLEGVNLTFTVSGMASNFTDEILDIGLNTLEWDYLFSGEWCCHDNTVAGAIARIERVIGGFEPSHEDLPWLGY